MRAGVELPRVQAEFRDLAAALAQANVEDHAQRGSLVTLQHDAVVGSAKRPLLLLLAAVSCVFLIACVNLANLMTSRGITRQPELALRLALGASRSRVVRLLLADAVVVAAASSIAGVLIAWWSLDLLVGLAPRGIPGLGNVAIDRVVLAYTAVTAAACALLIGLAPALRATRVSVRHNLGSTRTSTSARSQRRWLNGLIVTETALGVVLLVAAALVIAGLNRLIRTDPGFDTTQVATMRVSLPDTRYPFTKQVAFYDQLLPELARLPGVENAAIVGPLPLNGSRYAVAFELPDNVGAGAERRLSAGFAFVSPGYFRTMRIPIRQGREFTSADTETSPRTVVINESFARQYFPGEPPLGKRIKPGLSTTESDTPWREVVGVVGDVKQETLNEAPSPAYFVPHAQGLITTPHIVLRAARSVEAMPELVRQAVAAADPELAVYDIRTLEDRLSNSMANQRFTTLLLAMFAGLGLLLTSIGLYGVLAYAVTERMHEFGVRVALGASARAIFTTVLGGALALVGSGLLIGMVAAIAVAGGMTAVLDFVQRPDASTYLAVAVVLLAVAVVAAVAPARRAMRVDPIKTLRSA
jgi:putative ABC transport system permease protein